MSSPFLPFSIDYPKDDDEDSVKNFTIDTITKIHENVNAKEIGIYFPTENQNGQAWPKMSGKTNESVNGYRVAKDIGPLPAAPGPFSAEHGIDDIQEGFIVTQARAIASNWDHTQPFPDRFSSIPLVIENINEEDITVTVTASTINYENCMIVIDYLRSN